MFFNLLHVLRYGWLRQDKDSHMDSQDWDMNDWNYLSFQLSSASKAILITE